MATHNAFLAGWVKNAYGMELGLIDELERQTKDVRGEPQFAQGLNRHLEATRHHSQLLRQCLQRMGESVDGVSPVHPVMFIEGQPDGAAIDIKTKTGLIDYVAENYEVASYRALATLARQVGDEDTARICEEILRDETAMVSALDEIVPGMRVSGSTTSRTDAQTMERVAHDSFEALNAHDLDRWQRMLSDDYRQEAPGTHAPLDRQRGREYLQNYMGAFPDLNFRVLRTIAQGNLVVVDWQATGTHTGPLRSPDDQIIQPTHRKATQYGSTTFEFRQGKIHRNWVYFDLVALMQQLGLMPGA